MADLRSRTSKHKGMMHLLRCLVFVEASIQCSLFPTYIDTNSNHLADDLSRNNSASFLLKVPFNGVIARLGKLPSQPQLAMGFSSKAEGSPYW